MAKCNPNLTTIKAGSMDSVIIYYYDRETSATAV